MRRLRTPLIVLSVLLTGSSAALAQSFNVDVGDNIAPHGLPVATYAAAATQPGTWNARSAAVASSTLSDISGALTTVTLTRTASNGGVNFTFENAATTGDDDRLLDDLQDVGATGGTTTWTFNNLAAGNYALYTYAWAPDNATFVSDVSGGSIDPLQMCSGAWTGTHVQGVTYARHRYNVATGGSIAVTIATSPSGPVTNFASVNGFQLTRVVDTPTTPYCFGDGTGTACPCGNSGAAGNGCAHSLNANGANLAASGQASVAADSFVLRGTGMPDSSALYFQGTMQAGGGPGVVFGDGLRCAAGTVIRLGTKTNVAGASQYPAAGDQSISIRGMIPPGGGLRDYQVWYRNAADFCTPATFNLSNGLEVTWTP